MGNIIRIKEGGLPKTFDAAKLRTNLQGGGNCLWIPKDSVPVASKFITENGTYYAAAEGLHGFSSLNVSSQPDYVVGNKGGKTYYVHKGGPTGNDLIYDNMPTEIRVTNPPIKKEYKDGDDIMYTGMEVTAYDADGNVWRNEDYVDGIIPLEELEITPTIYNSHGLWALEGSNTLELYPEGMYPWSFPLPYGRKGEYGYKFKSSITTGEWDKHECSVKINSNKQAVLFVDHVTYTPIFDEYRKWKCFIIVSTPDAIDEPFEVRNIFYKNENVIATQITQETVTAVSGCGISILDGLEKKWNGTGYSGILNDVKYTIIKPWYTRDQGYGGTHHYDSGTFEDVDAPPEIHIDEGGSNVLTDITNMSRAGRAIFYSDGGSGFKTNIMWRRPIDGETLMTEYFLPVI